MEQEHKTVVIAEDEDQTRLGLSVLLRGAGYHVREAADGVAALAAIRDLVARGTPPCLVTLDVLMPGRGGLELLDDLARERLAIPTLVIAGHGDKDLLVNLLRYGCADYLDKPFTPDEFMRMVGKIMDRQRERNQAAAISRQREQALADERARLNLAIQEYQHKFEALGDQMHAAALSYEQLVRVDTATLAVPLVYRIKSLAVLGGDYLGARNTESGCDVLMADVAGHDPGAAFQALIVKSFFDNVRYDGHDAIDGLLILNQILRNQGRNERLVTALLLQIRLDRMEVRYVSAGHPYLVRLHGEQPAPQLLYEAGDVLGLHERPALAQGTFRVAPGDRLVMHSDGLAGMTRVDGPTGRPETMTREGVAALVAEHRALPLEDLAERIWREVLSFGRFRANDDMLLAAIEIPAARAAAGGHVAANEG